MKRKDNIAELTAQLQSYTCSKLRQADLLPEGYSITAEIRYRAAPGKDSRKVRSDAPAENYFRNPERYQLVLAFVPESSGHSVDSKPQTCPQQAHESPDVTGCARPQPMTALLHW
jgi:hypothetical protein